MDTLKGCPVHLAKVKCCSREFLLKFEVEDCFTLAFDFSLKKGNRVVFPKVSGWRKKYFPVKKPNLEMVKLRLRREGSKNRPYFRIVAVDSRTRREGPYIEEIGTYDPLNDDIGCQLDLEKADKWVGNGAQVSDTVKSLIKKARQAQAAES